LNNKKMPILIQLFLAALVIIELYYFFYNYITVGLLNYHGYSLSSLSNISYLLVTIFLYAIVIISLGIVIYGFIYRFEWTRKFTLLFLLWSIIWPVWGLIVSNEVISNVAVLIVYIAMILFLFTEIVYDYFYHFEPFMYNGYTLYKREVALRHYKTVTIHFFAKNKPKSGIPTTMPEGYEVGVNENSHMPFLRKIGKSRNTFEPFMYNGYTLYKREVALRHYKTVTIHFFAKNKPKSGTPTTMPEGYEVGVNENSHMPFLRKIKNNKKKPKNKVDEKPKVKKQSEPVEKQQKSETVGEDMNSKKRKPSNVIYVVSKPQPGQVKGDWAVRGHGKIYSHHRNKENAINAARKIADEKEATVMVQKVDGKFGKAFKPRIKSK